MESPHKMIGIEMEVENNYPINSLQETVSIDLILMEILKNLNPTELLPLRLVNSQWNSSVSFQLRQRPSFRFHFDYDEKLTCYLKHVDYFSRMKGQADRSLSDLVSLIKNSITFNWKFPYVSFTFNRGHLGTPDVNEFLLVHGHNVKYLDLNLFFSRDTDAKIGAYRAIHNFRNLMKSVKMNLEELEFSNFPQNCDDTQMQLFPDPPLSMTPLRPFFVLTKLRKLIFHNYVPLPSRFLTQILNAAINLKETQGFDLTWVNEFISTHKIHTIKDLELFTSFDMADLDLLCQLGNSKIQLETLDFDLRDFYDDTEGQEKEARAKFGQGVNKILMSSQSTLQIIEWRGALSVLSKLRKANFKKFVKSLEFNLEENWLPSKFLRSGRTLGQLFPNLETLQMGTCEAWDLNAIEVAQSIGHLTFLKILKVNKDDEGRGCPLKLFELMPSRCSFVKELEINVENVNTLPRTFKIIWQFGVIEKVTVETKFCDDLRFDLCQEMDSAMTGLSQEICEGLMGTCVHFSLEQANQQRMGPSILDMKCLKSFHLSIIKEFDIRVALREAEMDRPRQKPIISHVSGIYGLEPLRERQEFNFTIHFHPESYIGSVAFLLPYVDQDS